MNRLFFQPHQAGLSKVKENVNYFKRRKKRLKGDEY